MLWLFSMLTIWVIAPELIKIAAKFIYMAFLYAFE
jgi:hypothetical protein